MHEVIVQRPQGLVGGHLVRLLKRGHRPEFRVSELGIEVVPRVSFYYVRQDRLSFFADPPPIRYFDIYGNAWRLNGLKMIRPALNPFVAWPGGMWRVWWDMEPIGTVAFDDLKAEVVGLMLSKRWHRYQISDEYRAGLSKMTSYKSLCEGHSAFGRLTDFPSRYPHDQKPRASGRLDPQRRTRL